MGKFVKSRAKNKDGEWVYGVYIGQGLMFLTEGEVLFNVWIDVNDNEKVSFDAVPVDSSTLGRCLGFEKDYLEDIYEGDIVLVENGDGKCLMMGQVLWHEAMWRIKGNGSILNRLFSLYDFKLIKIGNIHDNPELLIS